MVTATSWVEVTGTFLVVGDLASVGGPVFRRERAPVAWSMSIFERWAQPRGDRSPAPSSRFDTAPDLERPESTGESKSPRSGIVFLGDEKRGAAVRIAGVSSPRA
jgi:hypothetical protein